MLLARKKPQIKTKHGIFPYKSEQSVGEYFILP